MTDERRMLRCSMAGRALGAWVAIALVLALVSCGKASDQAPSSVVGAASAPTAGEAPGYRGESAVAATEARVDEQVEEEEEKAAEPMAPPPAEPEPSDAPVEPSVLPSEAVAGPAPTGSGAARLGRRVIALEEIAVEGRMAKPVAVVDNLAALSFEGAGADIDADGVFAAGDDGGVALDRETANAGTQEGKRDDDTDDRFATRLAKADKGKDEGGEEDGEMERSRKEESKSKSARASGERLPAGLEAGRVAVRFAQDARIDALTYVHPERVLPRMFYFENTYLGGSAAYRERLIRLDDALGEDERPYRLAYGGAQPIDPPTTSGLEVTAEVDIPFFDQPRRAFLQVSLRGSSRYGWRRPPLDVMLVVDGVALARTPDVVVELVVSLLAELGPADRLGIVVAGDEPQVFTELSRLERARTRLATSIDGLATAATARRADAAGLGQAMERAGSILSEASTDSAIVPGTQTVLVVTAGNDADRVVAATRAAHALTVQGAVTSVFALDRDPERGGWWQVANAGHGNYHHLGDATTRELVAWELESQARVVARLVRVNIRLGKSASAIRVLGTRVLDEQEVAQVKAREVATDKNLSRALGITSDRGDDDDGIQTVIPYFYGDDSHVILVELWLDGPGPVADVTIKYKDMVNLNNATGRTSVRIDSRPRAGTPGADVIAKNVASFELAEDLQRASYRVRHGDRQGAEAQLATARGWANRTEARDVRVVDGFSRLLGDDRWTWDEARRDAVSESLKLAGERKVGESGP